MGSPAMMAAFVTVAAFMGAFLGVWTIRWYEGRLLRRRFEHLDRKFALRDSERERLESIVKV